jgi:hypothetical protein
VVDVELLSTLRTALTVSPVATAKNVRQRADLSQPASVRPEARRHRQGSLACSREARRHREWRKRFHEAQHPLSKSYCWLGSGSLQQL